jgi:glycogen synthase
MAQMHGEPAVERVLMTADAVGGVWTYAIDLCSALRAHGIAVTLAVLGPPMREGQRAEARRCGVDVIDAPYSLEWMHDRPDDLTASAAWLLELADRCGADLVHLNGFSHAAFPWRVPTVVVAHSCVRTWWQSVHGHDAPSEWDRYTERVTAGLAAASLLVAPTASLLQDIRREYGVTGPSLVIPNGSAALAAYSERPSKQPLVFSAGRLWDEAKNIAAVSALAPALPWPVYLAGEARGPGRTCVPSGSAHYLGRLSKEAITAWYARAAIYALPARYEPFGLSIVEAAAAGCALVLGDIRTLRENWTDAALFVPPDNRRALRRAIDQLIADADYRADLGRRARERALMFTVERMAGAYVQAYARLVAPAAAA